MIGLGLVGIAAALAVTLSQRRTHLSSTNSVRPAIYLVRLAGGDTLCQAGELVAGGTGAVRVFVGGYGKRVGPLRLTVFATGRRSVAGAAVRGYHEGNLAIRVLPPRAAIPRATVCIRNAGREPIALAGREGIAPVARVGSRSTPGRIEIEYLQRRPKSWWSLARTIAHRVGVARAAFIGGWSLWVAAILLGLAWLVALRQLLSEASRWSR